MLLASCLPSQAGVAAERLKPPAIIFERKQNIEWQDAFSFLLPSTSRINAGFRNIFRLKQIIMAGCF